MTRRAGTRFGPPIPAAMGAAAVQMQSIAELEPAPERVKDAAGPFVLAIDTDPYPGTPHGGHWWDAAVPEVSARQQVTAARVVYEELVRTRR